MSIIDDTKPAPGGRAAAEGALLARLASPAATAALLVAAIAGQAAGHIDSDVSWFITLAEKFLSGTLLYDRGDIVEPNPPLSFLSLVPAVALAQALHIPAEAALAALVFFGALASLGLCAFVLGYGAARERLEQRLLLNGAIWLLLLSPALVFAQREHLALIALAPLLARFSLDRDARPVPLAVSALLGVSAGLGVAFKPFFGLAVALPALAFAWRRRSIRALFSAELLACGACLALYVAAVGWFFPGYVARIVPFGVDVYSPAHESLETLATQTLLPAYAAIFCAFLVFARGAPRGGLSQTVFWASAGFFLSFLLQRKGWLNHAFPGLALLLFSWLALLVEELRRPRKHARLSASLVKFAFAPALIAAPFFFGAARQWANMEEYPGLRAAVADHAPAHPRLIALAFNCNVGHPLTRQLEGVWVGRPCSLWTSSYVGRLLETGAAADPAWQARLVAYRHADLAAFAEDVEAGRADAVIVESAALRDWAAARPELAGVLAPFEKAAVAGEVEVWTRRR